MLDGPLFTEVVAALRGELVDDMLAAGPTDTEQREVAYFQIRALDLIRTRLGQMARKADEVRRKMQ